VSADTATPSIGAPGSGGSGGSGGGGGSDPTALMQFVDQESGDTYGSAITTTPVSGIEDLTEAYSVSALTTVSGGNGTNAAAYFDVQFANTGANWSQECNFYRLVLQEDGTGTNVLYVEQGQQTGSSIPADCQINSLATVTSPGEAVTLQVTRDASNTYFNYSTDGGSTWTNAFTQPLTTGYDDGEALVRGQAWFGTMTNCDLNGSSIGCYPN